MQTLGSQCYLFSEVDPLCASIDEQCPDLLLPADLRRGRGRTGVDRCNRPHASD